MFRKMSITWKLIFTLGFVVILGFSSIVTQQSMTLNGGLHVLAEKNRNSMVALLAQNISGGIRWKKAAVIEKAYEKFVKDPGAAVTNVITMDLEYQVITEFSDSALPIADFDLKSKKWSLLLGNNESINIPVDKHSLVVSKVLNSKSSEPVGYIIVAFSNADLEKFVSTRSGIAVLVSMVAIAVILCALYFIVRLLFTRPMTSLNNIAHELVNGDGDLTRRLELKSRDELGEFADTINLFIEKLQNVMGNVISSADGVRGSLTTARDSATENQKLLDKHSSELKQADDALQTMSASLEGMSGSAQELAKSSADASEIAESANSLADDAVTAVKNLTIKVKETESVIHELDERS